MADVLFGEALTGRLSMTWPRTEAQVPINVGDAVYQPLFPFGWGLRTDSGAPGCRAGREAGARRSAPAALEALDRALACRNWAGDALRPAALLRHWRRGGAPTGAAPDTRRARRPSSVARDVAQTRVTAGKADADWARLIANADHALLTGDADAALTLLTQVVAQRDEPAATERSRRVPFIRAQGSPSSGRVLGLPVRERRVGLDG